MININELNLKKNPFEDVTPTSGETLIWAGMQHQKEELLNFYKIAFSGHSKKLVLNWGPKGGGKTHAAFFFGNNELDGIDKKHCLNIYIRLPREEDPIRSFVVKVIEHLLLNGNIKSICDFITARGKDFVEGELLKGVRELSTVKTFLSLLQQPSEDLILKYIYNNITSTQRNKLGLLKPLKTDEDCISFLSVFLLAISLDENIRIFLWIDEMENMIFYPSKKMTSFNQMLRDITDTVNNRFITFFNFTLSDNSEDTVRLLLGEFLWSRINSKIRFKDLTRDDAIIYCRELISEYQINSALTDTPFSKEMLEKVLSTIPNSDLIPREINKRFDTIINFAIQNDIKVIDTETINSALHST